MRLRVVLVQTVPVSIAAPYTTGGSDTFSVMVKVTSAPTGSAFRTIATNGTNGAGGAGVSFDAGVYARSGETSNAAVLTASIPSGSTNTLGSAQVVSDKMTIGYAFTSAPRTTAGGTATVNVNVTPDVAGSYTVLVRNNLR